MNDQPEALRVAAELDALALKACGPEHWPLERVAARLLREQHAEIERLRAQIKLYQWLRNGGGLCSKPVVAAIDAAMQERGIAQPVERTDGQQTARIKP